MGWLSILQVFGHKTIDIHIIRIDPLTIHSNPSNIVVNETFHSELHINFMVVLDKKPLDQQSY